MPTKVGLDQHNILHQHFPGDCCLCRTEKNIMDLEADNCILRKALKELGGVVADMSKRMEGLLKIIVNSELHSNASKNPELVVGDDIGGIKLANAIRDSILRPKQ